MFAKLTTALALFAAAAQVAVAAPPACLLAAVNTQPDPSDLKAVCDSGASEVKKYLSSKCGDNADAAMSAFEETCKDAGVTVSTSTSASKSSSASHSATGYASSSSSTKSPSSTKSSSSSEESESASATGTLTSSPSGTMAPYPMGTAGSASSGFSTATTNGTYSAPAGSGTLPSTPTESGISASTGAASRLGMDLVGLAAVGVFGLMLAL